MRKLNIFSESLELTKNDIIDNSSTSKGNQIKWFRDNYFIKSNSNGYESTAEVLVSQLLSFTNLPHVEYTYCDVIFEGQLIPRCCKSLNFLNSKEYLDNCICLDKQCY